MSMIKRIWIPLAAAAVVLSAIPAGADEMTFGATLTGASELPEAKDTKATGELKLTLSPDGKTLRYTVTVDRILNAAAVDLHLGPAHANGPLIAKLFPARGATAKKGVFSGVLADGSLDAGDLIGALTGTSIADLVAEIRAGNAYVNIHTTDGVDPANTGPGDYPLGEIRGQIK